jgi:hypothetical protein
VIARVVLVLVLVAASGCELLLSIPNGRRAPPDAAVDADASVDAAVDADIDAALAR